MRIEDNDKRGLPAAFIWLTAAEARELRDLLDDLLREPGTDWHGHVSSADYATELTVAADRG